MMRDDCFCRAGMPWSPYEEKLLEEYFDKGLSLTDLAWVHMRSVGGVQSRLNKMGRIEYDGYGRAYRVTRELLYEVRDGERYWS